MWKMTLYLQMKMKMGSNEPEETPAEELQPEEPETEKTAETEPAQEQPVEKHQWKRKTMEEK